MFRNRIARSLATLAATAALAAPAAAATSYTGLVVFGDSLSDPGNVLALTGGAVPVAPYYQGRFSNGRVAAEWLADGLGLSGAQVKNYAHGGAFAGSGNLYPMLGATGLQSQVALFASTLGGAADAGALYLVWGGANDFFAAVPSFSFNAGVVAGQVGDRVEALYNLGAREFLVPLMPNLGATPLLNGNAFTAAYGTAQSTSFNALLLAELQGLSTTLAGIHITTLDTAGLAAGAAFTNTTQACVTGNFLGVSATCGDPQSHLYWDDVHPSGLAHQQLGAAMLAAVTAVPEPATSALMLAGLLLAATAARRRRQPASSLCTSSGVVAASYLRISRAR